MKLLQDLEDAKAKRKSLKPQVERRRRERINRSLESLKTLLLQQQEESQRRVEKAEILEHTVLFLQNTASQGEQANAGAGGRKQSFQDGFSTCLHRAAQFLGPQGKGLWLGDALDASFASRFPRADTDPHRGAHSSPSTLLLRQSSRSILRSLMHRSGHRLCTSPVGVPRCGQTHAESRPSPTTPQQPHKNVRASKQSPPLCHPVSRSLWRPWP